MKLFSLIFLLGMVTGCAQVQSVADFIWPVDTDPCIYDAETNPSGYKVAYYQNACRVDVVINAAYASIKRRAVLPNADLPALVEEKAKVDSLSRQLDRATAIYRLDPSQAGSILDSIEAELAELADETK